MNRIAHAIYLHGFASSPQSSKAVWFARQLEAHGVGLTCPDFNAPAFETLTVSRMLAQTAEAVQAAPAGPVALIGSSLGAFVAVLAADRDTTARIDRLILLAPALDFGGNRLTHLGEQPVAEWRRRGKLRIMHYAWQREADIGFQLYEDAAAFDALTVPVRWPTLAVQGRKDDVVSPAMVEAWAERSPSVQLQLVEDGHQLSASLDTIWQVGQPFLGLSPEEGRDR